MFLERKRASEGTTMPGDTVYGEDDLTDLYCPSCILRAVEQNRSAPSCPMHLVPDSPDHMYCAACDCRYDMASWASVWNELTATLLHRLESAELDLSVKRGENMRLKSAVQGVTEALRNLTRVEKEVA